MLKQNTGYLVEAQKLLYLYEYLMQWAEQTEPELRIKKQIEDYVLSIALMRSGGRLPQDNFSTFDNAYYGKRVVIYSAGTFGQQLVNRFKETKHCNVIAWLDDDYWEYRRCCLDVDPVESVTVLTYDYILIATVDGLVAGKIKRKLMNLGVGENEILTITVPEDRAALINRFLDVNTLKEAEAKRKRGISSHA